MNLPFKKRKPKLLSKAVSTPAVQQSGNAETSLGTALLTQAHHIGISLDVQAVQEAGQDLRALNFIIQDSGVELRSVARPVFANSPLPMVLKLENESWVVILKLEGDQAILADPVVSGSFFERPYKELRKEATNEAFTIRKTLEQATTEQSHTDGKGHWFWSRVVARSSPIGMVVLGSFIANILAVVASLFTLQVYDRVIPNQSIETLWVLFIGVFAAMLFEAMLRLARTNVLDKAGRDVDTEVSTFLLRRLCALKLTPKLPRASQLSQFMREFGSVREFVTEAAVGALADIPFAIIFFLLIWGIAGPVVIVPIVATVLMVAAPLIFRKRMLKIAGESLGSQTASGRIFNEVSYGLETVKVARAEGYFLDQWKTINSLISNTAAKQRRLMSKLTQWAGSVQQAAYVCTVTFCVYQVFAGQMTVGAIIATTMLTSRALSPMGRLSTLFMRWHQVKKSLAGLDELVNMDSDLPSEHAKLSRNRAPGRIEVTNVSYHYQSEGEAALKVQKIQINPGEKIAILGTNGSGKSTLLRVLSGIYEPTGGSVSLDGTDMRQIDSGDLRRAIGFLPQDAVLFRGSLRDNLKLSRLNVDDQRILNTLAYIGLGHFVKNHPQGLEMQIADGGAGLSSGQRQSVGLARMLLSDPGMVLLDEPTANLDPEAEALTINRLGAWLAKRTLVVATHRMPILGLVDRVIVVDNGSVTMDGQRDEVLNKLEEIQKQIAARNKAAREKELDKDLPQNQKSKKNLAAGSSEPSKPAITKS